jgi:outer membrane protein assembly factor BamB
MTLSHRVESSLSDKNGIKMKSFPIKIFLLLAIGGILLSACAGGPISNSWPGVTAGKDMVYLSDQGFVFAVKVSDGSMAWRYPSDKANATSFFAAPALTDTELVVGDYGTSLYSLDPQNGSGSVIFNKSKKRWVASPLIVDNKILAPSSDGNLYALDLKGNPVWPKPFKTQQSLWAQPVSDGKLAFQAGMDHSLYAVVLADGSQVWSIDLGGAAIGSPALDKNGVLYIGTLASEMLALSADTGRIVWRRTSPGTIWGKPLVVGDNLYYGDFSGKATALLARDGSPVWNIDLAGPVIAPPIIFTDNLIFVMETGDVQAVTMDGKKSWSHKINGKLYSTPVVVGDRLVVPVTQGDKLLVALDTNGNEIWSFVMPK